MRQPIGKYLEDGSVDVTNPDCDDIKRVSLCPLRRRQQSGADQRGLLSRPDGDQSCLQYLRQHRGKLRTLVFVIPPCPL